MNFKIHRGTKEIGGSCVEVWTESTRILLDFGMPLVEPNGTEFDFGKYKSLNTVELILKGVFPDIQGLYNDAHKLIDGIIISHSHQDHYGLINYINPKIKHYLGEATHKIIELNNLFTAQNIQIDKPIYFEREKIFQIGDISITPFWADHSAFDAYSFLVEAGGKSIFYSGDFRSHGRKANAFKWFSHNAPQNVDYLLLEGTTLGRSGKPFKTEIKIESELVEVFKQPGKINLVYTSSQNIDRLLSIYRACIKTKKTLVVDVYAASVLKEMSKYASIPYPSIDFGPFKVMFPYYTSRRLKNQGNEEVLYQFKTFKITKEEISNQSQNIVMAVRPSMQKDLEHIPGIEGGNIIYSLWEGYLKKSGTKKFMDYLTNRQFTIYHIHTSGHADTKTLQQMVHVINPKNIVPIHTFCGTEYQNLFTQQVILLKDGETLQIN